MRLGCVWPGWWELARLANSSCCTHKVPCIKGLGTRGLATQAVIAAATAMKAPCMCSDRQVVCPTHRLRVVCSAPCT
jgi:hypothetical protein